MSWNNTGPEELDVFASDKKISIFITQAKIFLYVAEQFFTCDYIILFFVYLLLTRLISSMTFTILAL